jgi:predicted O-methyltransferase YrrM
MNDIEYINSLIVPDNGIFPELEIQDNTLADTSSFIETDTGKFLGLLVRLMKAKNVLEIGTCIGYSGIWICEALKETGGKLTTIEHNKKLIPEAIDNFKRTSLYDRVKLVHDDAESCIKDLADDSFDIVFQDAKKILYPIMLEDCIRVTRKNGLIIADDTLFKARGVTEKFSRHIHKYNELVFSDKRLYTTIVPAGEGLTLSIKL